MTTAAMVTYVYDQIDQARAALQRSRNRAPFLLPVPPVRLRRALSAVPAPHVNLAQV